MVQSAKMEHTIYRLVENHMYNIWKKKDLDFNIFLGSFLGVSYQETIVREFDFIRVETLHC